MKKGTFEGTSTKGSIDEAIANAITEAKEKLKTDLIIWNLESIIGINGGAELSNIVTISMKANKIKIKKAKVKKVKEDKTVKIEDIKTKEVLPNTKIEKAINIKIATSAKPKAVKTKVATTKKATPSKKSLPKK
jgi:flavin-binding protein dodecin